MTLSALLPGGVGIWDVKCPEMLLWSRAADPEGICPIFSHLGSSSLLQNYHLSSIALLFQDAFLVR